LWRGINFGGALDGDGDRTGGWLREAHFDVMRRAGFDTVRLPVKWSAHQQASAPHRIDATFFDDVARAVASSLGRRPSSVATDERRRPDAEGGIADNLVAYCSCSRSCVRRYRRR
jgi:hypothetical protein